MGGCWLEKLGKILEKKLEVVPEFLLRSSFFALEELFTKNFLTNNLPKKAIGWNLLYFSQNMSIFQPFPLVGNWTALLDHSPNLLLLRYTEFFLRLNPHVESRGERCAARPRMDTQRQTVDVDR